MTEHDETALAVARGAALLDEKMPGWETRIDLTQLNLADSCRCVLGQLFERGDMTSGFLYGMRELGWISGIEHGFDRNSDSLNPGPSYEALDEAWIALIKQRHDDGLAVPNV
jgi:hypothetical protein